MDPAELARYGLDAAGAVIGVKWLFDRWVATQDKTAEKASRAEEKAQEDARVTLATLTAGVAALTSRVDVALTKFDAQSGTLHEVQERVEGLSNNHGPRISTLEQTVAKLEERTDIQAAIERMLSPKRRRP